MIDNIIQNNFCCIKTDDPIFFYATKKLLHRSE